MNVDELAALLVPTRTTLVFGAGASIPSGAPSSAQLTRRLARLLNPEPSEVDLSEVAQLVENRLGRPALIGEVRAAVRDLKPTAGLLALPEFDWLSIYTTNYDQLVEKAYESAGRELAVYRSNYDVTRPRRDATPLYKIHGCVTQDRADGHQSRMIITESDYDDYERYRQTLFNSLTQDMMTSDTVIVGQSLSDRHLKDLARRIVALRQDGVSSRVILLVHRFEPDRVELYTRLGLEVVHASLDDFLLALINAGKTASNASYSTSSGAGWLTPDLVVRTTDVAHASGLSASAVRLFNGSPAGYADIRGGLTISRVAQRRLRSSMNGARGFFIVVEGARGVGKTTLARAVLLDLSNRDVLAWEHHSDAVLDVEAWLGVESRLRAAGREGILLVDDCSRHLREVNALVDRLTQLDRPHLRVTVTVDTAKWRVAPKSKGFFSRGTLHQISLLERADIDELLALLDRRQEIRGLVEQGFLALGRQERLARLQDKCSADMFVCLKNIFANDNLDDILLQEYATLSEELKDVYRYVAAVQSLGGHVHRQLVMRVLNIGATALDAVLSNLEGIVLEREVDARRGIYGWETRHDVIAEIISRLKFADQTELERLFIELIDGLNPSVSIELDTAISLATEEYGIARLTDMDRRVALFRRLIAVIPAHRTPRRRLTRLYLSEGMLAEAANEIRAAENAFGADKVLLRYKAQISLRKAETMTHLDLGDQRALLLDAESVVRRCLENYGAEVETYTTLGQIGLALGLRYGDFAAFDDAVTGIAQLEEESGDPMFRDARRRLERDYRRMDGSDHEADRTVEDAAVASW